MEKKIIVIIADGCEEIEALAPVDIFRRLNFAVTVAGLDKRNIVGSHQIAVTADRLLAECQDEEFDALMLPGGMPGSKHLYESETVAAMLRKIAGRGGIVSANCAAPIVLAKAGLLTNRRFTMYPGFESFLDGARSTGRPVEIDNGVITGRGPGATFAFAAAIAAALGKSTELSELYQSMFISF